MTGVFCQVHRKDYRGKYSASWKKPAQTPNSAIRCCRNGCPELGLVGLSEEEDKEYQGGNRVFTCGRFIRIEVE